MSETVKRIYCPSCGEEVDTYVIFDAGAEELHCFICGMALTGASAPAMRPLQTMLVAEDSRVFREVLTDKIVELGMAREVEVADHGEEFLEIFTRRLHQGLPVSLAVLDIRMPLMDGVNAAIAMRAIERGLGGRRPVPILFFSSMRCDEAMKAIFQRCAPARYINKGASQSPEDLADRLVEVIKRLMEESGRK